MDDAAIEKSIRFLLRETLRVNESLLELRASVAALKVTAMAILGEDPKEGFAQFEIAEKKFLDAAPVFQYSKELSELLDLLEKHPPKNQLDS